MWGYLIYSTKNYTHIFMIFIYQFIIIYTIHFFIINFYIVILFTFLIQGIIRFTNTQTTSFGGECVDYFTMWVLFLSAFSHPIYKSTHFISIASILYYTKEYFALFIFLAEIFTTSESKLLSSMGYK